MTYTYKVEYNPRCKYCHTQNRIKLNAPIDYLFCLFTCQVCRYNNMKEIKIK